MWRNLLLIVQVMVVLSDHAEESSHLDETTSSETTTLNGTSKADNKLEMLIIGSLSCLILLVLLTILACVCCNHKKRTRKFRWTLSTLMSSNPSRSLHHNTVGKSLYLTSDIKTVPSDEADALNRQFMLLKRCSRVKTTSADSSSSTFAQSSGPRNRATSSLGEAQKKLILEKVFSNPTKTELKMPTTRSHRPESTVKIVEVTSSLEERQKKRKMPKR